MAEQVLNTLEKLAGLVRCEGSQDVRWRLLLGFLDEFRYAEPAGRCERFVDEPPSTGDARWDVLLAAVAEHLAYAEGVAGPDWVRGEGPRVAGFDLVGRPLAIRSAVGAGAFSSAVPPAWDLSSSGRSRSRMSDEVLLTLARRAAGRRSALSRRWFKGGLRVTVASAELPLAMNVRAARLGDLSDIMFLAEHFELGSANAVVTLAASVFGEPVPDRQRMAVEDLFEAGG